MADEDKHILHAQHTLLQEIIIFRKADKARKNYQAAMSHHQPTNPPNMAAVASAKEDSAEDNSAAAGDN